MNESTLIQTGIWLMAGCALFVYLKRRRSKKAHR